jgi:murein L,D-transpeptidase YcbB/YkuD
MSRTRKWLLAVAWAGALSLAIYGITTRSVSVMSDHQVSFALRNLILNPGAVRDWRPSDRAAIVSFYRRRNYALVWFENGHANDRARSVIDYFKHADDEGLDPASFNIPDPESLDAAGVANAEFWLTQDVVIYTRQMTNGRLSFADVNQNIFYTAKPDNLVATLENVAAAANAADALAALDPPDPAYQRLKDQLKALHGSSASEAERQHTRNVVAANLERLRWLPRELGPDYVIVNIADYTLSVFHDGTAMWTTRIVVGEPTTPTPLMSANMTSITFNPIWNVPQSIVEKEYLKAVKDDPETLEQLGIESFRDANGTLHVYQLPGQANALGQIRFNFPNKFEVYQHDTPMKYMFEQATRAFSHGCMRVEDPVAYSQLLLSLGAPGEDHSAARIAGLLASDQTTVGLAKPIPVHLTYQTSFIGPTGALQLRPDIYAYDQRMLDLFAHAEVKVPKLAGPPSVWQRLRLVPERLLAHLERTLAVQGLLANNTQRKSAVN